MLPLLFVVAALLVSLVSVAGQSSDTNPPHAYFSLCNNGPFHTSVYLPFVTDLQGSAFSCIAEAGANDNGGLSTSAVPVTRSMTLSTTDPSVTTTDGGLTYGYALRLFCYPYQSGITGFADPQVGPGCKTLLVESLPNVNTFSLTPGEGGGGPFQAQCGASDTITVTLTDTNAAVHIYALTITAPACPSAPAVLGDPQFYGLNGQSFQVHGMDQAIYNLITDDLVQVNSRFAFLSQGECLHDNTTHLPLFTCWSHRGSYLSNLAIRVKGGGYMVVESGAARNGFASVTTYANSNSTGRALKIGDKVSLAIDDPAIPSMTVEFTSLRLLTIRRAGVFDLTVENSDRFVNLVGLSVNHNQRLRTDLQSHGLLGQTWRAKGSFEAGFDVKEVEGYVDDYAEVEGNLVGCAFVYNKFTC